MRISRLGIENFRSIRHLVVGLGESTVLVGPNNAGKTAILDALRVALTRRWGQRGTGFSEYDIHLPSETTDSREDRRRCRVHQNGDLESQLVADGLGLELRKILTTLGVRIACNLSDRELVGLLREKKSAVAAEFAVRVRRDGELAERTPEAFRHAIRQLRGLN